jgi:hypothetical protein
MNDYWKEKAEELHKETLNLRSTLAHQQDVLLVYQIIGLIGWVMFVGNLIWPH